MKLFLASFMERDNFGPGKIVAIIDPEGNDKPADLECDSFFKPFTPSADLVDKYNGMRGDDPAGAADMFVSTYRKQLEDFAKEAAADAKASGVTVQELLPFSDGDTLASWERGTYTNYRKILAPVLEKMGYVVSLN